MTNEKFNKQSGADDRTSDNQYLMVGSEEIFIGGPFVEVSERIQVPSTSPENTNHQNSTPHTQFISTKKPTIG